MNRQAILKHAPTFIIIATLAVSAPRLSAAFSFVEAEFFGLPVEIITGPAFGLSVMGATVYVWSVYEDRKRVNLAKWLLIGWCVLVSLIVLIIVPGMVVQVRQSALATLLSPPLDVVWCVALAICAEVVIGLTAFAKAVSEPKAKKKQDGATVAQAKPRIVKVLTTKERRMKLLDIWRQDGDKSFAELAQGFNVSRQTISNDFAKLRNAGKVRRNGGGIEVVVDQEARV